MASEASGSITSALQENRVFPPPKSFSEKSHIKSLDEYRRMYRESLENPDKFWGDVASQLHWFKKWDKVLEWKPPYAKWFVGGTTNLSYNCLDRQIAAGKGDKVAILWEGEPLGEPASAGGEIRKLTYNQLRDEVCRFANGLKKLGVKQGDRVTIYLPMVPEAAGAML